MENLLRFSTILAVAAASCCIAPAQNPGGAPGPGLPTTTLQVSTRLVVLDVSVVDSKGKLVTGLDRSQFTITENKVPQIVRSFEAPEEHALVPGQSVVKSSADLGKIGSAPVTILVLDELNTPFADRAYAQQQMESYLKKQPEILSTPTLLVAASDKKFIVLHDYTQDRSELMDAVKHHFPDSPWAFERGDNGSQLSKTLMALEMIADSSRGTRGRKNVIWVGKGYSYIDETQLNADARAQLDAIVQTVTRRLMDARVTLYTIDPGGAQASDTSETSLDAFGNISIDATSPFDLSHFGFQNFAAATGGSMLIRNDVASEIVQQTSAGENYYTLSYTPTENSDAAKPYRQIRVQLKDPSLHAVTRAGYYASGGAVERVEVDKRKTQPKQLAIDLTNAATSTLVYNGLHISSATRENDHYVVLVHARDLHWDEQSDGTRVAETTVAGVAFDSKGHGLAQHVSQLKASINASSPLDDHTSSRLVFTFDAGTGARRVRIVVRDATTGAIGTFDVQM